MKKRTCLNCQHMRICYLYQQLMNAQGKTGGIIQDFKYVLKAVGEECKLFEELWEEE